MTPAPRRLPRRLPRRFRPPSAVALLIVLATVVALMAATTTALAVYAYVRLDADTAANSRDIERIEVERRTVAELLCMEDNRLRATIRRFLESRDVPTAGFEPDNCRARALELVPMRRAVRRAP